ncbi:thymidine kinase, partial [Enterococcus faecalis]|nr:thymidine kinase [Enterococcus faecalis]
RERDMRPLIAKPAVDTLADGDVHSRIGIAERAHLIHDGDDLSSLADGYDCLIIDEAQFLTPDQVDQVLGITLRGTPVLCYGLRTDF